VARRPLTTPRSWEDGSEDVYDIVVVGAGILGLATAREVLRRHPLIRLLVVDKEPGLAAHQTGHNSGVLHAGLYYQPGSLKARLCRAGKASLEDYAGERGIGVNRCGKLVIAANPEELPALDELRRRGEANGVPGIEMLGPAGLKDVEPHAVGCAALWSPSTSIIDYRAVSEAMADDVRGSGGEIQLNVEITSVSMRADSLVLTANTGSVVSRHMIACAGLHADHLVKMTGTEPTEQIVPFRGDYYTLTPRAADLVRGLIYPVPDPRFPFLGIHLTRTVDGRVLAGPNAVLALQREGYRRRDFEAGDVWSVIAAPGFRHLARRYWRTGISEMWRDWNKRAFLTAVRRFVPEIESRDLGWGPSGVRAQAVDPDGSLVDDFRLGTDGRCLHVRNAPSPAATASMAIANHLVDQAELQFADLG
jgi:L-2-hydroxyglutarate oxidase LhgO